MIMQRKMRRAHYRHARKSSSNAWRNLTGIVTAGMFLASLQGAALAAPAGGSVTVGAGTISQNGSTTNIHQATDKMGINWQSFNIAKGETVNFIQPGASSIALNRVVGNSASAIYGALNANGQVFLVNPNGVLFGQGAQVNVGGITASTLNISDADFQKGNYKFVGKGGQVVNQGTINAGKGGVALLGGQVTNEGVIVASKGNVALGAGSAATLDFNGDGLLNLAVDQGATDALAANKNLIEANGGLVIMTASAANELAGTVVNNSGIIRAQSIANVNGEIRLNGGDIGTVVNSGTLDASGLNAGESGGKVTMLGANTVLTKEAKINASGNVNGGFVETSGNTVNLSGTVDAGAGTGTAGTWSIDPYNIEIKSGSGTDTAGTTGLPSYVPKSDSSVIYVDNINNALNAGTSVNITTGSGGGQPGDITVNADIVKTAGSDASLTLTAARDVVLNGDATNLLTPVISSTFGKLNVVMNVGSTSTKGAVVVEKDIKTNGGSLQFGENQTYAVGTYIGNHPAATNLHRIISTANADNSSGGSIDFYGDVMLGSGADGTEIDTAGGDVVFHAKVNSGNKYEFVNFTQNGKKVFETWSEAKNEAETGDKTKSSEAGYGMAVGEHYLATITSALEDVAVRETAGYKVESWAGGHTDDHITWKWMTGPEQGTAFYNQSTHSDIGGAYDNFKTGEPNNYGGENSLEVNYDSASRWNDYAEGNTYIAGYVKETNLADTSLVINAVNNDYTVHGNVTFGGEVGTLKAMDSVIVNNANNVAFNAKTVADTKVDVLAVGNVTEGTTAGKIYTPVLVVNTNGGEIALGNDNNVQSFAATTNGVADKNIAFNDVSAGSALAITSIAGLGGTVNGVSAGTGTVFIRNTGGLTLNQPVITKLTNTDQAVTLVAGSNTAGAVFTNNVGGSAIQMGSGSYWLVYSKNPFKNTLGSLPYAYSQYGTLYSYTASGEATDSSKYYAFSDTANEKDKNGMIYADDLTITPTLTPVVTKVYDGTTDVTDSRIKSAASYSTTHEIGGVASQTLSGLQVALNAAQATGVYGQKASEAAKDVAAGKPVTVSGIALDTSAAGDPSGVKDSAGNSVYNAKLVSTAAGTGDITKKALTLNRTGSPVSASKTYDGTTAGTTANITALQNAVNTAAFSLTGVVEGETVGVTAALKDGSLQYTKNGQATKNVGADGITFGLDATLSGDDMKNYDIDVTSLTMTGTGTITPAPLTLTAVTPNSRIYDGTTGTGVTPVSSGLIGGDGFTTLTEDYTDKNVGTDKGVTIHYTIDDGNGGGNYAVTLQNTTAANTPDGQTTATGTITAAHITANQQGSIDKIFDNTATATLGGSYGFGDGAATGTGTFHTGDQLTLTGTGVYDSSVIGSHTTSFTGLVLGGADAGNYILDNTSMTGTGLIKTPPSTVQEEVEKATAGANISTPTSPTTVTSPAGTTSPTTSPATTVDVQTSTGTVPITSSTTSTVTASSVSLPLTNMITAETPSGTTAPATSPASPAAAGTTANTAAGTTPGTTAAPAGTPDGTGSGTTAQGTTPGTTAANGGSTAAEGGNTTGTVDTTVTGTEGAPGETVSELTVTSLNGQSTTYSLGMGNTGATASTNASAAAAPGASGSTAANGTTQPAASDSTESTAAGANAGGSTAGLPGMKQDTSIAVYRVGDGATTHVADYKAEGSQAGLSLVAADRSREVSIGNTADYQMTYATLTVNGKKGTYNVQFNGETVVMVPLDAGAKEQVASTENSANKPVVMGGILATMNELATPLDQIKAVYIYKL